MWVCIIYMALNLIYLLWSKLDGEPINPKLIINGLIIFSGIFLVMFYRLYKWTNYSKKDNRKNS